MENSPFYNQLLKEFNLTPTRSQEKLFAMLDEFTFKSQARDTFVLKGYAGTGKTSAISAYIRSLKSLNVKTRILAPTGRAAKVIALISGEEAYTIHKQIYRRKSKVEINSPISLNANLHKNTMFIVDEASMIGAYTVTDRGVSNRNLLSDLIEYVYSGSGCKLILMGDDGQLPPVGSDVSPALDIEYLKFHYPELTINLAKLDEVLRQSATSEVLRNATLIRSHNDPSHVKFDIRPNADLVRIGGAELQEELENSFSQHGYDGAIIITRSNKRANLYNEQIRGRILWYEEQLCQGDCLMAVKNNYHWVGEDSRMGFIANGELFKIIRILKYESHYGFDFARVMVLFIDYQDLGEVELIILLETLSCEGPSLERERMKELFYGVEQDYVHIRDKKKRYEAILADPFFNALQVKYAYAVTCHKSQGGQWQHVYIDQGFIPEDQLGAEYNRWLYTALTRATDKVYLVNFEEKFFTT